MEKLISDIRFYMQSYDMLIIVNVHRTKTIYQINISVQIDMITIYAVMLFHILDGELD